MKKNYTTDPKGRRYISAAGFVLTVLLLAVLNILRLYAMDKFPQYMPDVPALPVRVINVLMIILAAVYVVFILILLPMWYKSIRYVVNDNEIISYSGIISRTYRIMKLSSVQHAVRVSLPFSGRTGFNLITLKALGGNMPVMFLSDKDCGEILELFRRRFEKKAVSSGGKYSVEYSAEKSGYVYTDNSDILSSVEIRELADDYESVKQLSFDDMSSEQLSFTDMENDGQQGGG